MPWHQIPLFPDLELWDLTFFLLNFIVLPWFSLSLVFFYTFLLDSDVTLCHCKLRVCSHSDCTEVYSLAVTLSSQRDFGYSGHCWDSWDYNDSQCWTNYILLHEMVMSPCRSKAECYGFNLNCPSQAQGFLFGQFFFICSFFFLFFCVGVMVVGG